MHRIFTRLRSLVLLIFCLALVPAAKDKPTEQDLFLNSPAWGDFRKAKKVLEPGQVSLKVWDHLREYLQKFHEGAPDLRTGQDQMAVPFDEVWALEQEDYLKLGKKRGTSRAPDLVKLYWKGHRVQALTVERGFKIDPLTFQAFPQTEYRLMAIFPRDYLMQELARQAQKDKAFQALLPFEHLREAKNALAEGNPDAEDPRQRTHGRLGDARRHLEAITRKHDEYGEARELLQEVARREKELKKHSEAMAKAAEEQAVKRRQELAAELDREFLTKGFDVKIELKGSGKDAIFLDCVLFSRPMVFFFLDKSDLVKQLKNAGFREVTFSNKAIKYYWEIDLDWL
ncbi:MAG: hypothetical protein FJ134_07990 [Deltaproteobacteria bacterium]|nr:hypothetical protein [Deltaproteobacteria bacterium]